jgi:hypothetical protein
MDAKIAFIGNPGNRVEKSRIIGTGLDAILTTDAQTAVDDHDAILFTLVCGTRRADVNTLGVTAMIAQPRQEVSRYVRKSAFFSVLDPGTGDP